MAAIGLLGPTLLYLARSGSNDRLWPRLSYAFGKREGPLFDAEQSLHEAIFLSDQSNDLANFHNKIAPILRHMHLSQFNNTLYSEIYSLET
jgi:hypothetical protein